MGKGKWITLTQTEAETAVAWYQKTMRLRDWIIRVEIRDGPPAWWRDVDIDTPAACQTCCQRQSADIWVSNLRCQESEDGPVDPLATLFHECEHVRAKRDGTEDYGPDPVPLRKEFANTCIGRALARLYRLEIRERSVRGRVTYRRVADGRLFTTLGWLGEVPPPMSQDAIVLCGHDPPAEFLIVDVVELESRDAWQRQADGQGQ